ncbi:MAG: S-adenosylmethionine:tRNA ribosyltransferase-isomerase [Bradymonadia bacterium]
MSDLGLTSSYDYSLPDELIAAAPATERTGSRLLVLAAGSDVVDDQFSQLPRHLRPGDVLVINDARVTPVRCSAKRSTGGAVEVFVLGFGDAGRWENSSAPIIAFSRSNKRLRSGERLIADGGELTFIEDRVDGTRAFSWSGDDDAAAWIHRSGDMPLPPYIVKRRRALGLPETTESDRERYQTVFASAAGAVAAPTAGLHFDNALLRQIKAAGVEVVSITLQVGAGTFKPVIATRLDDHVIHSERLQISADAAERITEAKRNGHRVVAVGTTVVRTLESAWRDGSLTEGTRDTALFIRPGFDFQVVDALITNFHLPKSTLLALVSAFAGYDRVMHAYEHAVAQAYRFYSYGDSMLLERHVHD